MSFNTFVGLSNYSGDVTYCALEKEEEPKEVDWRMGDSKVELWERDKARVFKFYFPWSWETWAREKKAFNELEDYLKEWLKAYDVKEKVPYEWSKEESPVHYYNWDFDHSEVIIEYKGFYCLTLRLLLSAADPLLISALEQEELGMQPVV